MLARPNRVVSGLDYRRITRSGRRARGDLVLAYARRTTAGEPLRIGVIVARNVGNAVVRNRVRRRIKAVGWSLARETDALDVVVRALPQAARAPWPAIEAEIRDAVTSLASGGEQRQPRARGAVR